MAYLVVKNFGRYWLARHSVTNILYVAWYDAFARQTRRRSLKTNDVEHACAVIRNLIDRGIMGDPKDALLQPPPLTVAALLAQHESYIEKLASAETELIQARRLTRLLGEKRIGSLVLRDFETFRDTCVEKERLSISTVARTLSTLRSAIKRAIKNRELRIDEAPFVPSFLTQDHIRSAPPKARIMTIKEIGRMFDGVQDLHLMVFLILLVCTGSRPGALLELQKLQIDGTRQRIALNPPGRKQTKKYRPTLPCAKALLTWTEHLTDGHLVQWRGRPVDDIDNAIKGACKRAGLPGGEGAYSIRHALARFMREQRVPLEEVAVWLGHIKPPTAPHMTLIYSPDSPDYLANALAAVEKFVGLINEHTQRDLLSPPWLVMSGAQHATTIQVGHA